MRPPEKKIFLSLRIVVTSTSRGSPYRGFVSSLREKHVCVKNKVAKYRCQNILFEI